MLCLVTDRARCGGEDRLVELVSDAAAAGVHLVQVREKDLEARPLGELVRRCVAAVRGTRTRVIVNDRLDVALGAGAAGVHLPAGGVAAARVRELTGSGFLIGRSVHGLDEATRVVEEGGLDYLVFGAVFDTGSKPGLAPAGLEALRAVVRAVPVPVLGIGGITLDRLPLVAAAGAAGAAGIGLFTDGGRGGRKWLQTLVAQASLAFDTPRQLP